MLENIEHASIQQFWIVSNAVLHHTARSESWNHMKMILLWNIYLLWACQMKIKLATLCLKTNWSLWTTNDLFSLDGESMLCKGHNKLNKVQVSNQSITLAQSICYSSWRQFVIVKKYCVQIVFVIYYCTFAWPIVCWKKVVIIV